MGMKALVLIYDDGLFDVFSLNAVEVQCENGSGQISAGIDFQLNGEVQNFVTAKESRDLKIAAMIEEFIPGPEVLEKEVRMWSTDRENRGSVEVKDDGDFIHLRLHPDCGGATFSNRLDWLRTAAHWCAEQLDKVREDDFYLGIFKKRRGS
jgi:hypothetical protein